MSPPVNCRHFLKNINSKNSLFLAPTDAYEIQRLIENLKIKYNSSPNDIPSKFWKIASCTVSEWLSNCNKCMTIGEFPDSWKIAHISAGFRGDPKGQGPPPKGALYHVCVFSHM